VNYPFKLTLTNVHISPFLNLTLTLLRSLSPFVIHQHSLCSPKDKHHLVLNLVTCNIHRKEFDVGWMVQILSGMTMTLTLTFVPLLAILSFLYSSFFTLKWMSSLPQSYSLATRVLLVKFSPFIRIV